MNDDAFVRLIAEDVKNTISDSQKSYLLMPGNWSRWQRGLSALVKNLDEQIDLIQQDEEADAARYRDLGVDGIDLLSKAIEYYSNKKTKIRRFKFHVEKRLDEVNSMIESGSDGLESLNYADILKAAIIKHKKSMEELEMEPTDIDIQLWESVDSKSNYLHTIVKNKAHAI